MSEWNAFQRQCGGSGMTKKQVSALYRQHKMRGGGVDTIQPTKKSFLDKAKSYGKTLVDAGKYVVKNMDDIIETSREAKKLMDDMYIVDPKTGKKTLKTDPESIKKYQDFLKKVGNKYDQSKAPPPSALPLPPPALPSNI